MTLEALPREENFVSVLPDELPTVKDLSSDFEYLLNGHQDNKYRMGLALEYADHLKARFEPGVYTLDNEDYARSQIVSRLYLDAMVSTARRSVYSSMVKRAGNKQSPHAMPALLELINAKLDLQKEISDYAVLNPNKNSLVLFGNLAQITHHGRRMLYGDEVSQERAKQENLTQLCAILAEYKVLSAIHEDWPLATFGTIEQDTEGTDIVIPSRDKPQRAVALQVKSSRSSMCELTIRDKDVAVPVIKVPMDLEQHDPLRLSFEHSSILKKFILHAPKYKMAYAA